MEEVLVGEIFSISDEEGKEHDVEVLASVQLDGIQYVAVAFVEDLNEDIEEEIDIFFFKIGEEGDFETIDSDEEFEKVSKHFDELLDEE